MNRKKQTTLLIIDVCMHGLVYICGFIAIKSLLNQSVGEAYLQFQQLTVQPPLIFALVFAIFQVSANQMKQPMPMLDYVIDVGNKIIPLLSSVVAVLLAAQAGVWYLWVIAILATVSHLYVKTQISERSNPIEDVPMLSLTSLAAIGYVGSYVFLVMQYLFS